VYAIVDIETTGGHAASGAITEIAIILHNGQEVEGSYHTLVNPGCPIPRYITVLTGIDDEMVKDAPAFSEVAHVIFNLLSSRIFIAHNVNFDYSFIRHHLLQSGIEWDVPKLCTVRLTRKLFPGYPSYSLGNICRSLDIKISDRHRAKGDATATAELFTMLLRADDKNHIAQMLKKGSREAYLPIHLPVTDINKLPDQPGVYYFHDQKQKVIYVGKAKNLQKRVTSHFSNNSSSRKKQELIRKVHRISFNLCGTEFTASVMESLEIKKLWPQYNYSQKKWEFAFGLFQYEDQQGRQRLGIGPVKKNLTPIFQFHVLADGHRHLWRMVREFKLCPKLCFLQKDGDCIGVAEHYCDGVCDGRGSVSSYNERVEKAVATLRNELPSFAIVEEGRDLHEKTYLLMEEGKFYGFGFVPLKEKITNKEQLKKLITPYPENEYVRSIILRHAETFPHKKVSWHSV
jgi:DNA polymerase-3 subunit epsilon